MEYTKQKKLLYERIFAYLVEGYTDVIQMYQKGIENIVSSSGTALSPEQIQLIRRLTSNVLSSYLTEMQLDYVQLFVVLILFLSRV